MHEKFEKNILQLFGEFFSKKYQNVTFGLFFQNFACSAEFVLENRFLIVFSESSENQIGRSKKRHALGKFSAHATSSNISSIHMSFCSNPILKYPSKWRKVPKNRHVMLQLTWCLLVRTGSSSIVSDKL